MFSDYKALLVEFYQQKRDDGSLSQNLLLPTPGKLKKECLRLLGSRNSKADLKILREFCGLDEGQHDIGREIKKLHNDKFKPLDNFLEDQSRNTGEQSIELLALLIDFPERPFRYDIDYSKKTAQFEQSRNEEEKIVELGEHEKHIITGAGAPPDSVDAEIQALYPVTAWYTKNSVKRRVLVGLVCAVFFLVISFNHKEIWSLLRGKQCMYWANDQYVAVDCDTQIPNITILALDEFKYNHLKKINRLDTISPKHINKVHYSKINNAVEFYTMKGEHPEYPDRHLKPMTGYMYEKYIVSKKKKK